MIKERIQDIVIKIPKTKTHAEITFQVNAHELIKDIKKAKLYGQDKMQFNVEGEVVTLDIGLLETILRQTNIKDLGPKIPRSLDEYLIDLSSKKNVNSPEKISSRDEEIEKLWTCLTSKTKCNAILVGEQGVGKTTMSREIVRQINALECPVEFYGYKVIQLNLGRLMTITSDFMMKSVINKLLQFALNNKNKVIFYIDNLLYMKYDIYLIKTLQLFLTKYNIKLIASIGVSDFNEYFIEDDTIIKYLNPILLEEPDINDIYPMLKRQIRKLQKTYEVKISRKMIQFSILTGLHLSSSYSSNPESTLDVINFALADAKRNGQKEVIKKNVLAYYYIDFKLNKKTNAEEKRITAYHEAGHYIVAKMSENIKNKRNAFVSIMPIEGALV